MRALNFCNWILWGTGHSGIWLNLYFLAQLVLFFSAMVCCCCFAWFSFENRCHCWTWWYCHTVLQWQRWSAFFFLQAFRTEFNQNALFIIAVARHFRSFQSPLKITPNCVFVCLCVKKNSIDQSNIIQKWKKSSVNWSKCRGGHHYRHATTIEIILRCCLRWCACHRLTKFLFNFYKEFKTHTHSDYFYALFCSFFFASLCALIFTQLSLSTFICYGRTSTKSPSLVLAAHTHSGRKSKLNCKNIVGVKIKFSDLMSCSVPDSSSTARREPEIYIYIFSRIKSNENGAINSANDEWRRKLCAPVTFVPHISQSNGELETRSDEEWESNKMK